MPGNTVLKNELKEEIEVKKPNLYKVILHNDDYTTMDFVIEVLISVFNKPMSDATKIMLDVHKKGRGTVGLYTYDIALSKTAIVDSLARERDYPLKTSIEEI